MKILVTGGLGYIGSHTVVALQQANFEVVIVDNLSNSSVKTLQRIQNITNRTPGFIELDITNSDGLAKFFKSQPNIEGVIHFAASKAVGESVAKPLYYYKNNICGLIYLLEQIQASKTTPPLIFSSSCTVYGQAKKLPVAEDAPVLPAQSPYGNTKQIGEEVLSDWTSSNKAGKAISLRYFNPIGAHESAQIGELPLGVPQNLVPFITQTAIGLRPELTIFGNDYPTRDGTCIRDYIYVGDLAQAHVKALKYLLNNKQTNKHEIFNVGVGKGNTVLEVIKSFENVTGQAVKYKIGERREGDVAAAWADSTKARHKLEWQAQTSLDEALRTAWKWEKNLKNN